MSDEVRSAENAWQQAKSTYGDDHPETRHFRSILDAARQRQSNQDLHDALDRQKGAQSAQKKDPKNPPKPAKEDKPPPPPIDAKSLLAMIMGVGFLYYVGSSGRPPAPDSQPPPSINHPLAPTTEEPLIFTPPGAPKVDISRYKTGSVFRDCPACPDMVIVPAGSMTMGSHQDEKGRDINEGPQRTVKFAAPFAAGRFEVTRNEFDTYVRERAPKVMDECRTYEDNKREDRRGRSFLNPGYPQDGRHPAVCVSFYQARDYLSWLSEKSGKTYRLLTEAEWEYAARAGTTTPFFFGSDTSAFCDFLNGSDASALKAGLIDKYDSRAPCDDGYAYTAPVGSYKPNAFGLYDMLGNANEWVEDFYEDNYIGAPNDGAARESGRTLHKVVRGGSWDAPVAMQRAANRVWLPPYTAHYHLGFRVARSLP